MPRRSTRSRRPRRRQSPWASTAGTGSRPVTRLKTTMMALCVLASMYACAIELSTASGRGKDTCERTKRKRNAKIKTHRCRNRTPRTSRSSTRRSRSSARTSSGRSRLEALASADSTAPTAP
eukprot:31002-Pelagococcus_subviridis.AAC.5